MLNVTDNDTRATAVQSDGAAVLRGLKDDELIDILNRLMLFAAKRYYERLNAEELAMQALTDVLAGIRTWDTNYSPFKNLCWIVRSIASNQLQKEWRLLPYGLDVETGSGQLAPLLTPHPSPSETYETDETLRGLRDLLYEAAGDDGLMRSVVELSLEHEEWKPKEMAAALNVSETDIYEARRRIRRRLGRLRNKS